MYFFIFFGKKEKFSLHLLSFSLEQFKQPQGQNPPAAAQVAFVLLAVLVVHLPALDPVD